MLSMLKVSYHYHLELLGEVGTPSRKLEELLSSIIEYILNGRLRSERMDQIINFILEFKDNKVVKFVMAMMEEGSTLYLRFQKVFIKFIQKQWEEIKTFVIDVCLKSVDHIKVVYVLLKKLNPEQSSKFMDILPKVDAGQEFTRDLLKINFILVQGSQELPQFYLDYLEFMIERCLLQDKTIEIHE